MTDSSKVKSEFSMPVPVQQHALMKPLEGTFRAEVKIFMGPGDPVISTGTIINSWHLDGLYLNQDYTGDRTDGPFPEFRGKGYMGFNTTTGKFEGFWIDNASTTMQMETGGFDEASKTWEMHSQVTSPSNSEGGNPVTIQKRTLITVIDNDHHTMTAFMTMPDGPEFKSMEIAYQRS